MKQNMEINWIKLLILYNGLISRGDWSGEMSSFGKEYNV